MKPSLSASIYKRQSQGVFPVISEIKVRSEKEGDLLRGRDPVALAREMARRPVAGISVVTEASHFGGTMDLLKAVAAAVDLPVLHKDFITTERQIEESAACGAQALLLITAMLELDQLTRLIEKAKCCGLETLVEAHNLAEVEKIQHLPLDVMHLRIKRGQPFHDDARQFGNTLQYAGKDTPALP